MKLFKIAPTSKYNSPEIIPILGDLNNILNTLASHINTSIFGCFWVLLHSQGNHATAATRFRHSGWRAAHLLWLCDTVAQQLLTADMKRSTHPILTQLNLECYSRISFYFCFSHCSTRIGVFILSLTLFVLTYTFWRFSPLPSEARSLWAYILHSIAFFTFFSLCMQASKAP